MFGYVVYGVCAVWAIVAVCNGLARPRYRAGYAERGEAEMARVRPPHAEV